MTLIDEVAAWLSDPAHWTGPDGMLPRLLEHLELSGFCMALAIVIALPIGLWIGHTGRGAALAIRAANIGIGTAVTTAITGAGGSSIRTIPKATTIITKPTV